MNIQDIADEIIGLSVVGAATGCGVYVTWLTGEVPGYLTLMAGAVIAFYFGKKKAA